MLKHPSILAEAAALEVNTLEYLVSHGTQLSNESASLPFIDSIKSTFYDFVSRLNNFITGLKVGNFQKQSIDASVLLKALSDKGYQASRGLQVTVQPGFQGKWVPYLKFLQDDILPTVAATEATLKVAVSKLAVILNEPDRLKAQSGIRDLEKQLKVVSKADFEKMKAYYNTSEVAQAKLSDVVERQADLVEAYLLINKLNVELAKIDFTTIQGQLDRLADMTNDLKDTLAHAENREVSGLIASQLSSLFYNLGITLTAGAMLMDSVLMQTQAMQDTVGSLTSQIVE